MSTMKYPVRLFLLISLLYTPFVEALAFKVPQDLFSFTRKPDTKRQQQQVLDFVSKARKLGPVGVYQTELVQKELLEEALALSPLSDPSPSKTSLEGTHTLLYSAAKGGSSGKLAGPIYGKVTQEFPDEVRFVNAVEIGPLKLGLRAERKIKDNQNIQVFFKESFVQVFGKTVVNKEISGGGVWKMVFTGQIEEDGVKKLIRVMETPSLFVLETELN